MKRITSLLLTFVLFLSMQSLPVFAAVTTELIINGAEQTAYTVTAVTSGDEYRLLAPANEFLNALGASVTTNGDTLTITKDDNKAVITVGQYTAVENNSTVDLAVPAQYINDVVCVPTEFCGEALGFHVIRERGGLRVRIVRKTGTDAPSDSATLKPGTAELVSTVHRPVPTQFTRSNALDDLIYMREDWTGAVKLASSSIPEGGEVVFDQKDFEKAVETADDDGDNWHDQWRTFETVDVDTPKVLMGVNAAQSYLGGSTEALPFTKAFRIKCTWDDGGYEQKLPMHFKNMVLPVESSADNFILSFYARTVAGGNSDTGKGEIQWGVHYGNTWKTFEISKDWQKYSVLITRETAPRYLRMRFAIYKQTIDFAGFEVRKMDKDADLSYFTCKSEDLLPADLSPDAEWRKDALERIEQVRKGDFTVVVQDKNGNPVKDAEVTLDMFEHEFHFGVMMDEHFINDDENASNRLRQLAPNFNTVAVGNGLKWDIYATAPDSPGKVMDAAKNEGMKYFRGHALWMPMPTYDGNPKELYDLITDTSSEDVRYAKAIDLITNHFKEMNEKFPYIYQWDVINEAPNRTIFSDTFSNHNLNEDIFKIANETMTNGQRLAVCDNAQNIGNIYYDKYWDMLDTFKKDNVNYDVICMQGHSQIGSADEYNSMRPTSYLKNWDRFAYEYGKDFEITEYSIGAYLDEYGWDGQADFTRDVLIAAFSHPACTGFSLWWLSDTWLDWSSPFKYLNKEQNGERGGGVSPFFGSFFEEKPGLEIYQDLLYNKWWTRNATATTDSNGKSTVKGFYGDYDITVKVNGQTVKTDMAAFHKGYENVLKITLD